MTDGEEARHTVTKRGRSVTEVVAQALEGRLMVANEAFSGTMFKECCSGCIRRCYFLDRDVGAGMPVARHARR
ncbi:MAG: hypothetical protein KDK91_22130, partial [Gammaproteobacteria bacterium]|nr:hypothetical protein [Gammaproteobacteria bacterium]